MACCSTRLYESIWSLIGVALLLLIDRKFKPRWGKLFAGYLIYYSIGRIWVENLRIDPSDIWFGLRTNVWSAILGIAVGLVIIFVQRQRHPEVELSVYLPGREPAKPADDSESDEASEPGDAVDEVAEAAEAPKPKRTRAKKAESESSTK